jgi:transposase InsO family protein
MSDGAMKIASDERPDAWLSLDEAARRSGISAARLRGYAKSKYEPAGLAEKREVSPGTLAWFVHESADERFTPVRMADSPSRPAAVIGTPKQIEVATYRLKLVRELEERLEENRKLARPRPVNEVVTTLSRHLRERRYPACGRSSLLAWHAAWLAADCELHALYPADADADAEEKPDEFADYYAELRLLYLGTSRPQKSVCIRTANMLASRSGWLIPHDKAARRFLETLESDRPVEIARFRGGPKLAEDTVYPYLPRSRELKSVEKSDGTVEVRAMRSDEIWCADHHVCDAIVNYRGKLIRPWLTAVLDIRSNRIVGVAWSPKPPNSHSVLLAFRDAIMRNGNGIPDEWFVDNGKDFDCWMFQGQTKWERRKVHVEHDRETMGGIMNALKIETRHARPYNARSKPVERFFGIFEEGYGKFVWTYCGRTPSEKPEDLDGRLRNLAQVPTYEEYVREAEDWIYRVHHAQPLTTRLDHGMTRDAVYQSNRTSVRLTTPETLEFLLVPFERRKVGRMGVTHDGWNYHDPSLVPYIGQEVSIRVDPRNVTTIAVWEMGFGRKIADVESIDLAAWGAVSDEVTKRVRNRIEAIKRKVKELNSLGGVGYAAVDRHALLAQARREVIAASPEPTGPSFANANVRMAHTPLDGQLSDVQSSIEQRPRRKAAGGELIDLVALGAEGL